MDGVSEFFATQKLQDAVGELKNRLSDKDFSGEKNHGLIVFVISALMLFKSNARDFDSKEKGTDLFSEK